MAAIARATAMIAPREPDARARPGRFCRVKIARRDAVEPKLI
jgi:hypothetical protein